MTDHTDIPTPGFYLHRTVVGKQHNGRNIYSDYVPVKISREVTPDPDFSENAQDRSPVIHCYIAEREVESTEVWPWCALAPIEPDAYWNFVLGERGND